MIIGYNHLNLLEKMTFTPGGAKNIIELWYDGAANKVRKTIDYKYNIRGWMTEINDVSNCNTDLFRMKLNYEVGNSNINAAARWNGNISSMEWRVGNACMVGGSTRNKTYYGFTYDNLNRLTQAKYAEYTTLYTNFDRYNETLTYNLSGDITTLVRRGYNAGSYSEIDNLAYAYPSSGTFRLSSVTETSNGTLGFTINAGQTLSSYTYDNNGNITVRTNVGYSTINYNHLNLPHTITGTGGTINNSYDAGGRKWTSTSAGVVTTYFSGIEYEGNALKAIYHEDGRIEKLGGGTYEYQFYIRDHLGNVRILLKSGPTLMQEYHYYPFGLEQGGSWAAPQGLTQKYKYNGKEYFGSGLGWYDFGARWYDPAMGRWISADPLSETYANLSPYCFVNNNPIQFFDPNGMEIKNAHADDLINSTQRLATAMAALSQLKKGSDGYKSAKKEYRAASNEFNTVSGAFNRVESKLDAIKSGNSSLYENLDNLKDAGGNTVDVYVQDVNHENLQEGRYPGADTDVFGDTDAGFGTIFSFQDGSQYMNVKSKKYSENTVHIRMSSEAKTRHLAHEFGHAEYQTENTLEYYRWILAHPEAKGYGGHYKKGSTEDPSGIAARLAEKGF
ncbi:MAG TPA: RHS repeat-associated core domain-containing protein [Saprospiraceae bacterium]|nr:RHS repeat-associated core domain-containing protein [Saprospiraceae bacterium]